ncbi:MAG: UDP-3-O-(3-hydroxymyristoyl)glucosamine N-acyltransferase [Bacteroidetes bacterium]|nr:UDP-3-O-(3-hydroxymyristoyl)glucosamine N-acyltransferase [Bacteroidota bacterium]MBX7129644.1 UDP-3-O-(3-hydroxymyristoyl)glucosamine N-acyltransferase [Flavobacteriales bacterium]MCC6655084.1 UDP-3-O-(3-hydroxymyristoyl)glucosamine N-acyltransferase [Flavobacteriales bacterium]HMU14753.1 UDP-3-O-(3-hydroxymyristoyl)glucosamine N-acyltransferase [Flavobacteriales bacterium]HMW97030.1 UDP-3-O-(3-hydroxymyristoyl)glucosamine N-acyltransferase [Flavobacteriales bacterium]
MDLKEPLPASGIAALIGAAVRGNAQRMVTGINEINRVREGDLLFVDHPKYYAKALNSAASVVLINKDDVAIPEGKAIILCTDPCTEYNKLVVHFSPRTGWNGAAPSIGEHTEVHPSAVIGPEVRIGRDCRIMPGVVIYGPATIGDRVILHANTVLGADPFYYKKRPTGHDKMPPCGSVVIEDDVEIGALCTIDRGVSADTRIGKGTKLDNHVQVGHDTLIGAHCLICAHVAIAGAVVIEDGVTLWGQVGVPSKIRVGRGAVVMAQSGLLNNAEPGKTYLGSPAREVRDMLREISLRARLPEIARKIGL